MHIQKVRDIIVIELEQTNLDAGNYKDFKATVNDLINGEFKVLIDMNSLQFIDSAGLGAVLSILRKVHEDGGDIKISRVSKAVKVLFDLVRLGKLMEIYDSKEDALASFS